MNAPNFRRGDYAPIRHGPCIRCGAPVTVRDDGAGELLLCLECDAHRPPLLGVLFSILLLVGGAIVVALAVVR